MMYLPSLPASPTSRRSPPLTTDHAVERRALLRISAAHRAERDLRRSARPRCPPASWAPTSTESPWTALGDVFIAEYGSVKELPNMVTTYGPPLTLPVGSIYMVFFQSF